MNCLQALNKYSGQLQRLDIGPEVNIIPDYLQPQVSMMFIGPPLCNYLPTFSFKTKNLSTYLAKCLDAPKVLTQSIEQNTSPDISVSLWSTFCYFHILNERLKDLGIFEFVKKDVRKS